MTQQRLPHCWGSCVKRYVKCHCTKPTGHSVAFLHFISSWFSFCFIVNIFFFFNAEVVVFGFVFRVLVWNDC